MDREQQRVTAERPLTLTTPRVTKLADAAVELFRLLYDLERAMKRDAKTRAAVELDRLDLFGLTVNRVNSIAEEYQPDERDGCS